VASTAGRRPTDPRPPSDRPHRCNQIPRRAPASRYRGPAESAKGALLHRRRHPSAPMVSGAITARRPPDASRSASPGHPASSPTIARTHWFACSRSARPGCPRDNHASSSTSWPPRPTIAYANPRATRLLTCACHRWRSSDRDSLAACARTAARISPPRPAAGRMRTAKEARARPCLQMASRAITPAPAMTTRRAVRRRTRLRRRLRTGLPKGGLGDPAGHPMPPCPAVARRA
jgi:hypothetical protein